MYHNSKKQDWRSLILPLIDYLCTFGLKESHFTYMASAFKSVRLQQKKGWISFCVLGLKARIWRWSNQATTDSGIYPQQPEISCRFSHRSASSSLEVRSGRYKRFAWLPPFTIHLLSDGFGESTSFFVSSFFAGIECCVQQIEGKMTMMKRAHH